MSDASRLPPGPAGSADLALRAATLFERLRGAPVAAQVQPSADARHLLDLWQRTYSPGSWSAFTTRLAWDGLTPDGVLAALSVPASTATDLEHAAWTEWINAYLAECRASAAAPQATADAEAPRFLVLLLPALTLATRELAARLSPSIIDAQLGPQAIRTLGRRLLHDLWNQAHAAFAARYAVDAASDEASFARDLLGGGMAEFLHEYPVLARHMAWIARQWVETSAELIERLAGDRAPIAETFFGGTDPGPVVDLDPALSDPHHGRRRVARLDFGGGRRLIYKPRDIGLEHAFAAFLRTLGDLGLPNAPRAIAALPRGGYGWVEHVTAASASAGRGDAWFGRAGALLCIAHVLRGRDLHKENVVATADGPVLVDVELLIQPMTANEREARRRGGATHADPPSCLTTGFLTDLQTTPDGSLIDVGGLQGRIPEAHRAAFLDGFEAAYRCFIQHRAALLASGGPLESFAGLWTRVIGRPTDQYAMLLSVVATPRYQQSGVQRSAALDALNRTFSLSATRPALWSLTADERRSLERLDIPLFQASTDERDVFCEGRRVLAGHFATSGLEAVRERLRALDTGDLEGQLTVLRRATAVSIDSRFTADLVVPSSPGSEPALGTRVVAHALWIAGELLAHAAGETAAASAPERCYLYDGELGPALFHAAVAATAGSEASRRAARETVRRLARSQAWEGERPLGACSGDGSLIYALTCISALLDEDEGLDLAVRVSSTIAPSRIASDAAFDVSNGSAGAILALLALYARTNAPDILQRAAACGDHLLAARVAVDGGAAWPAPDGRLYVGFAHGAAGVGLALLRLFLATRRQEFLEAAAAAHRFERHAYLPGQRNWPVAAGDPGGPLEVMTAWCHGAPGLALARTQAAVALRDRGLLQGLEAALKTTAGVPVRLDDHLCCGNMGRCDVLLTAGTALPAEAAVQAAWTVAGDVIARAERERRYRLTSRGHELRVFDPGFFRGLSGIGYQLLRLAAPSRLPSVLSFDPPPSRTRS